MSSSHSYEEKWEHFFKPEVRSSGRSLFAKDIVRSSQPSETEVVAYIRGTSSYKVSFKSESVSSATVVVNCSCPASEKGQFCKHIWATLLKVEDSHPDFLDGKEEIVKAADDSETAAPTASFHKAKTAYRPEKKPLSQAQIDAQEALKKKQADYRKQQYQKQKQRLKDQKQAGKKSSKIEKAPEYPREVQGALDFFAENGFSLENSLYPEAVRLAKKRLSRVFHPDIGGSHGEIVVLNEKADLLISFIASQKSEETK